ncbi:methyl-accepting chemotaxis protein [Vibrio kyushuensis]|uniref:methyl-accepting chemotaxis protein n=1 Tax=Vibrio kyushuensis TaxID=2910249 RepID=UPI003D0A1504
MLNTLLVCYSNKLNGILKDKFQQDFMQADRVVMFVVIVLSFIVATITPWQHGYFSLGIGGGIFVSIICVAAYNTMAGSMLCRMIMATALVVLMAITVQQSNGLGEGHFLFFLGFTILIRYRDIIPVATFVVFTVAHHLTTTYCQSIGVEIFGAPLLVFSWGTQTSWGLLAPLIYHVVFAVMALIISTYYIFEGNKQFVESNSVIGVIEKASTGDLTVSIQSEVESTLIAKVNAFFTQIREMLLKIESINESLSAHVSETSSKAAQQTSRSNQQQQEVNMVATAVTEMTASTQDIANNAEHAADVTVKTEKISEEGEKLAVTCKTSITQLAEQVQSATEIISNLEQNSSQIHGIVATIKSISEQTNLLALNAAIEAARAGEQGRGFAVVADEVRVLSQRTHDSTEEISAVIATFQSTTNTAVSAMGTCHDLANSSVTAATDASQSFEQIAAQIKSISDMAQQIATAAEQQTSVTGEINQNTEKINLLSSESFADSEGNAQRAQELENQAQEMSTLLKGFTLR